jgi:PHP family Zn ribbon phosphoesterase
LGDGPAESVSQLITYRAELHVHTVLSPCAEVEMIPPLIIQEALNLGINILGITDHNASANVKAVMEAAEGTGIHIFPGMELQTVEEVHLLCLFDSLDQLLEMQRLVDKSMPGLINRPDYFGEQFVVDFTGEFIRREESLLLASSSLTIKQTCDIVKDLNGLLIPAHVNRRAFGLLTTLGLIPEELQNMEAFEISRHISPENACLEFPQLQEKTLIQSGDVHRLSEFLGVNYFKMEQPSIEEMEKAFRKMDARDFHISKPNL